MEEKKRGALVSACLLGIKCRYDGNHKLTKSIKDLQQTVDLIPVCPEQMGGLRTPRPTAQVEGGDGHDVLDGKAKVVEVLERGDVTREFLAGAENTLTLARFYDIKEAYLKSRSPSCGCGNIVVDGKLVEGDGVTTALLKRSGIEVFKVE
jgi:uncharacterized protein YbbK (DUF523 family)